MSLEGASLVWQNPEKSQGYICLLRGRQLQRRSAGAGGAQRPPAPSGSETRHRQGLLGERKPDKAMVRPAFAPDPVQGISPSAPQAPGAEGFSLLEVLVATAIMGLVLVVLLQVLTSALRAQEASWGHTQAVLMAEKILQENCQINSLKAGTYQGRDGRYDYVVRVIPQDAFANPCRRQADPVLPDSGGADVAGVGPAQDSGAPDPQDCGSEGVVIHGAKGKICGKRRFYLAGADDRSGAHRVAIFGSLHLPQCQPSSHAAWASGRRAYAGTPGE